VQVRKQLIEREDRHSTEIRHDTTRRHFHVSSPLDHTTSPARSIIRLIGGTEDSLQAQSPR